MKLARKIAAALFAAGILAPALAHADSTIDGLTAGSALSGSEELPMWQGTATYKTTASNIANLMTNAGNLSSGTLPVARLPLFSSTANGAVPLSGGGTTNFLRADGSWAAPPGGSGSPGGTNGQIQYNNNGAFGGLTIGAGLTNNGGTLTTTAPVSIKTGAYTVATTDAGSTLVLNSTSAAAFTIPAASTMGAGTAVCFVNENTGALTLSITTSTAYGLLSSVLPQNASVCLQSDGTNYAAFQSNLPLGSGLAISNGVLGAQWGAGTVTALGSGLSLSSGTLSVTAGGGNVSGPGTSTVGDIATFSNTSGTGIQDTPTLGAAHGGTGATSLAGANIPVQTGTITTGDCVKWASGTSITDAGAACGSGGGTSPNIQIFTTTGANTWTYNAAYTFVEIYDCGGGGGGASGAAVASGTASSGGAGGGGGECRDLVFRNSDIGANLTITVGAGGAGGVGGNGAVGGNTTYTINSVTYTAYGGGGSGAGYTTASQSGSGGDINAPGSINGSGIFSGKGQGGNNGPGGSPTSPWAGGGGSGSPAGTGPGLNGAWSWLGGPGGGAGGGNSTAPAAENGGSGGGSIGCPTVTSGGAGSTTTGSAGGSTAPLFTYLPGCGGAGGGASSGATGTAGNGGAGTNGGGGGGGGSALTGGTPGNGGQGGNGFAVVRAW